MDIRGELAALRAQTSAENKETPTNGNVATPTQPPKQDTPKKVEKRNNENEGEEAPRVLGEYDCDANDVINFKLAWNEDDLKKESFRPLYTHQIFGEDQIITGYKDLKVDFSFAAGSLFSYLNVTYGTKKEVKNKKKEEEEVTPVAKILCEKFPQNFQPTTNLDTFVQHLQEKEASFKPVGERLHSYQITPKPSSSSSSSSSSTPSSESTFEIYAGDFLMPEVADYHEKLQFFVLFYIDCANYIEPDPDWRVFFLFEKKTKSDGTVQYGIVGYCTAYLFYYYPESKRLRISQFVILPPYHRQSHGINLLRSIYDYVETKNIADITVEDPTIEFGLMKDKLDLELIVKGGYLKGIPLGDRSQYAEIQKKLKINKAQIRRCHEMYVFMTMDKSKEDVKKAFRIALKRRFYKKYLDALSAEPEKRKHALQELYKETENDYWQITSNFPIPSS